MNLFKKAAVFTDIHFGKRSDSEIHNQDCLDFIDWFVQKAKQHECDTILFLGDWFHDEYYTKNNSGWASAQGIEKLKATGLPIYWLIGNHDCYYKTNRSIHSLPFLAWDPQIFLINEPRLLGDVLLCPYLQGEEFAIPPDTACQYVFGHFSFPFFKWNYAIEAPDRGGLTMEDFYQTKHVFSGHYHMRQTKINLNGVPVTYIGNPFPHDFNDVNDRARGCMILEWGEAPIYENWTAGPNFNQISLSKLLALIEEDRLMSFFNGRSVIKCKDDLNISQDESFEIREALNGLVRGFSLEQEEETLSVTEETHIGPDESVSDMVVSHIGQLDTAGTNIKSVVLIELFRGRNGTGI